jgi:hypothetical protein
MTTYPLNKEMNHNTKHSMSFIENMGQDDERAYFSAGCMGRRYFFSANSITAVELEAMELERIGSKLPIASDIPTEEILRNGVALELSFLGANSELRPKGLMKKQGYFHYLQGNDESKWSISVPHYKQLHYDNVWNGVNLELCEDDDGLKMNWLLESPTGASSIKLRWTGANNLEIGDDGSLLVHHVLGILSDKAPMAYQLIDGNMVLVSCRYRLDNETDFSFELGSEYRSDLPLVIDPLLQYSTYLGGDGYTYLESNCASDPQGSNYIAGFTGSTDFPLTPGAFQTVNAGFTDVFVTKFTPDGSGLIYSTLIGGSGNDSCYGMALDSKNCVYVVGSTNSEDYPITPGVFQSSYLNALETGYVTKLSADGSSLIYSTYLGGNASSQGNNIVVDTLGYAYITGNTTSTDFPVTPGAYQTTFVGTDLRTDTTITKLSPNGSSLVYSTYLGGSNTDNSRGIAIDSQGCAYVSGFTLSTDFPTTPGAFQTTIPYNGSAYVTKFSPDGSILDYSTYLGGNSSTFSTDIIVDSQGCAYVTGMTASTNYPVTQGTFQTVYGGGMYDGYITKFAPDGQSLICSTYLGGNGLDRINRIALDAQERVYVTGYTESSDFPITPQVVYSEKSGEVDVLISIFSQDLSQLIVSRYLGGTTNNQGVGITVS